MKLPRSVSGDELIKSLQKVGYSVTRQKGSHVRLSCSLPTGDHHITIPKSQSYKNWNAVSYSHRDCTVS